MGICFLQVVAKLLEITNVIIFQPDSLIDIRFEANIDIFGVQINLLKFLMIQHRCQAVFPDRTLTTAVPGAVEMQRGIVASDPSF